MNFSLLSKYDDMLADVFLDGLFLWFATIKMNTDHQKPPVPSDTVLNIVQKYIINEGKLSQGAAAIAELDFFRDLLADKTDKEVTEFLQHTKRYLMMFMPKAGYEISDTSRYDKKGPTQARVVSTKDWNVGDEMRMCTGVIANLNAQEDAALRAENRDFSIMYSTRKGCSSLFLGPARFMNHDCDSNSKFISCGSTAITFKVVRPIKCGEEITVFYGTHYFGENNCECRCATCERRGQGYFTRVRENNSREATPQVEDTRRRSARKRKARSYGEFFPQQGRRVRKALKPVTEGETAVHPTASEARAETPVDVEENIPNKKQRTGKEAMRIDFICNADELVQINDSHVRSTLDDTDSCYVGEPFRLLSAETCHLPYDRPPSVLTAHIISELEACSDAYFEYLNRDQVLTSVYVPVTAYGQAELEASNEAYFRDRNRDQVLTPVYEPAVAHTLQEPEASHEAYLPYRNKDQVLTPVYEPAVAHTPQEPEASHEAYLPYRNKDQVLTPVYVPASTPGPVPAPEPAPAPSPEPIPTALQQNELYPEILHPTPMYINQLPPMVNPDQYPLTPIASYTSLPAAPFLQQDFQGIEYPPEPSPSVHPAQADQENQPFGVEGPSTQAPLSPVWVRQRDTPLQESRVNGKGKGRLYDLPVHQNTMPQMQAQASGASTSTMNGRLAKQAQPAQVLDNCRICGDSLKNDLDDWLQNPGRSVKRWPADRCGRCYRHFIIFNMEWPHRKAKKVKKPKVKNTKRTPARAANTSNTCVAEGSGSQSMEQTAEQPMEQQYLLDEDTVMADATL